MASKDDIKNLNTFKKGYKDLKATIGQISQVGKNNTQQLRDTLTVLELIKKGYIDIGKDASKFGKILNTIANNGGLDKNLAKIGKTLGLNNDQLKKAQEIHREIDQENKKSLKLRSGKMQDELKGSKEILDILEDQKDVQEDITESVKDRGDAMDALSGIQEQVSAKMASNLKLQNKLTLETQLTKLSVSEIAGELDNLGVLAAAIDPIIDGDPVNDVDVGIGGIRDSLSDISSSTFTINGITGDFASSVGLAKTELDNLYAAAAEEMDIRTNVIVPEKISAQLQKQFGDIIPLGISPDSVSNLIAAYAGIEPLTQEQIKQAKELHNILKEKGLTEISAFAIQEANLRKDFAGRADVIDQQKRSLDLQNKHKVALGALSNAGDQFVNKLSDGFNSIFSPAMQGLLGIDQLVGDIGTEWKSAVNGVVSDMGKGIPMSKALGKNFGGMVGNVVKMVNPLTLTLGLVAGLFMALNSVENSAKNISKELGVSRTQALGLYKQSLDITNSFDNQVTSQEDILSVMKKHQDQYGVLLDLSNKANQESINFAANLGSQYGMAAGEVYGLSQQFKTLGANSEVADNLTAWLAKSSELSGIPFATLTKDMAEASEMIATHFDGMPEKAAKSAVEIRRMGMSLKQAGAIMEKALDPSAFMGDMAELNAMTGGMSDLSGVFEMTMKGEDPAKIAAEAVSQFDKLPESMKKNQFIAKKFASSIGMSVDELKKGAKVREMSKNLSEEQQALLEKHLGSMSEADLLDNKSAMMAAERLSSQEKFATSMNKLKGELMSAFLPLIMAFGDAFSAVIPVISVIANVIGSVTSTVVNFFGKAGDGVQSLAVAILGLGAMWKFGMLKPMGKIGGLAKGLVGKLTGGGAEAGGKAKVSAEGMGDSSTKSMDGAIKSSKKAPGGENIKTFLKNLAEGLTSMGTGKVFKGALNLIPASIGLIAFIPGYFGAKLISKMDGAKLKEGLENLANGLTVMGTGGVLLGGASLIVAGIGFAAMTAGAIGMAAVAVLGKPTGEALKSLGQGVAAFGAFILSGVGAVGLIAFAGLAMGLGFALGLAGPAIEAFGTVIGSVFNGLATVITAAAAGFTTIFDTITSVDPMALIATAYGIGAIGAALLAFGVGMAAGGIGAAIGNLFGGGPMEQLAELAELADPLPIVADAISSVVTSIEQLGSILDSVDLDVMDDIIDKLLGLSAAAALSSGLSSILGIGSPSASSAPPAGAPVSTISSPAVSSSGVASASPTGEISAPSRTDALLRELIREVKNSNSTPIMVTIGDQELQGISKKMKTFN